MDVKEIELVKKKHTKEDTKEFSNEMNNRLKVAEDLDARDLDLINSKCNGIKRELLAAFYNLHDKFSKE